MYPISKQQYKIAKDLGVQIHPSKTKNFKIDIHDKDMYIFSVGDIRYNDYFTYLESHDKAFADNRRRLYDIRTKKGLEVGSRNFFARKILWDL